MQSTTKIPVSQSELSRITEALLGERAAAAEELADGWFNTIYRIDLANHDPVVIKLAPPSGHPVMRYERELMSVEVAVLRLLADTPGVPVPRVLAHDASGTLHAHEFFLMDHLAGSAYSAVRDGLSKAERDQIDAELGEISARINAIPGERFGRFRYDHCQSTTWPDTLALMVDDLLLDASDAGTRLPVPAEAIRAAYAESADALHRVTEPRLVVWDLHPGNVFVQDGHVSGIIDCDRALWGDPLMEFFFRSFAGSTPAFFAGYGRHERETADGRIRAWLYDLYLALIMVIECDFRGFTGDHAAWAKNRFLEVMASRPDSATARAAR